MKDMQVGLIADTHDPLCDWNAVVVRITEWFAPMDLILHCGDLTSMSVLDDLEAFAPVRATRSDGDPPAAPPRLTDGPTIVDVGGRQVLLAFQRPERAPDGVVAVVYGGTHAPNVETIDGVVWANPGSPSLAEQPSVGVLRFYGDAPGDVEIIALADGG